MIVNNDYFLKDVSETKLENNDLVATVENIFSFLKQIKPNLKKEKDSAIEIRLLRRDTPDTFLGTFRVTDFNKYTQDKFLEFLKKVNGIKYCMYYSVYSFNQKILPIINGEEKKIPKIAKNNALDTEILVADFDNISEEKFEEHYINFIALDIEPSITIFSGHGFQCIWKLNERFDDKSLLKKFTNKLIENNFPVDSKIKDCARLMRMPYSFNCKDYETVIPTTIFKKCLDKEDQITEYSLETIFNRLTKNEIYENKTIEKVNLKDLYPMLNINEIPKPIQEMLKGFVKGSANNVLMFLTLYFREQGYSKGKIKEIMQVLASLGTYPWDEEIVLKEVERFFHNRQYNAKTVYLSNLKEFGYLEFQITNNDKIKINNYVFASLKDISNKAFIVYLKMLISVHNGEENLFTLKEISDTVQKSERRLKQQIDELLKIGLLDKKRSYKKSGDTYSYYINGFLRFTEQGFSNFHIATLKLLLKQLEYKEINETQVVICLYLKQKCFEKDMCFLTLEKIGNDLGLTKSTISKAFTKIEELKLITRTKISVTDFQYRYNYYINY